MDVLKPRKSSHFHVMKIKVPLYIYSRPPTKRKNEKKIVTISPPKTKKHYKFKPTNKPTNQQTTKTKNIVSCLKHKKDFRFLLRTVL